MAHDIFISYSSDDKPIADAVCASLETRNIRCWITPRDVLPGQDYAAALVEAINDANLMVLVFSSSSNDSPHVSREVERAASKGIPIVPFRIEDVRPSTSMEYYISATHWLDAVTPPMRKHLQLLADTVERLLSGLTEAAPAKEGRAAKVPPSPTDEPADGSRNAAAESEPATRKRWYKGWILYVAVAAVVLIAAAVALVFTMTGDDESSSAAVSETASTTTIVSTTTSSVASTTTTTRVPDVYLGTSDFSRQVPLAVGDRVRIELTPLASDRIVSVEWEYEAVIVREMDVGTTEVNGFVTDCWLELEALAAGQVTVRTFYTRLSGGTRIPWVGYLFISN